MPTRLRVLGFSLLVGALAATFLGGGTASAVAGGEEVADGAHPFVAKISIGDLTGCTGVLVDARWVLTAKDCFADGTGPVAAGAPKRPTTVYVGRTDVTKVTGHRSAAMSVLPHPDRNLALVELSAPIKDIAPIGLGTRAVQDGESLRIAGYGRTATQWVPNRLHAAAFEVATVGAGTFDVQGSTPAATVCKGDAGGPAFREVDGKAELVGISSVSWQKGCLGSAETRDGATEVRTDDLVGWIRAGVARQPNALREPVTGEFNRDGIQDLIAADAGGLLWLYPGTSVRNVWGDRVQIGSGWSGLRDYAIGRINRGDQFDDLVGIEPATGKLWMYPGTEAGGRFGPRVEIGTGWTDFRDITIGKVNRDGFDDLLTVKTTTNQLVLYRGNATGPRFDPAVVYGTGWNCCKHLTMGEFNNDDYDDLLTADVATGGMRIYPGTATGAQFGPGADAGAGTGWSANSGVAAGTFDDSGIDGLLAVDTTGQSWVHPRSAEGGWLPPIKPAGNVWVPQPYSLGKLVTGEFNRDAWTDLIGTDAAGVLWLHPGTATGLFGPAVSLGSGFAGLRDLAVGRINRADQFDDLVGIEPATGKLWLYPGTTEGGAFGTRVEIGTGWAEFRDITIGKVNRDGFDDLLVVKGPTKQLLLYAGNATGPRFTAGVQYGTGWDCCKELTLGRFNKGDDYDDLLTVDAATGALRLYPGTSAGDDFGARVDPGAGDKWLDRTELTAIRFAGGTRSGLLSKEPGGALVLHQVGPNQAIDWLDPIRFGPRD